MSHSNPFLNMDHRRLGGISSAITGDGDDADNTSWRASWAQIDLGAVRHNVRTMLQRCTPAALCAVVKADGYGHGAAEVARAALDAGASLLAVALVEEGVELRRAGIEAPILILSEPPLPAIGAVRDWALTPTVYSTPVIAALAGLAATGSPPVDVHLKVDTGMHRLGADPADALSLGRAIARSPALRLAGLWTHLAVADEPDRASFTEGQLRLFEGVRDALVAEGIDVGRCHAANSAAALTTPEARYDLVRCGIALYGYPPSPTLAGEVHLRPALSLKSRVGFVRQVPAGDGISYGLSYIIDQKATIVTVPLGYADGVPRRLSAAGGTVLIGGVHRPMAGTVTMDQFMADCGPPGMTADLEGAEVVLIGTQGDQQITAADWAAQLDTIPYEILCGIGSRVPRIYIDETGARSG